MSKTRKKILASIGVMIGMVASLALGIFQGVYAENSYVSKGTVSALISCYEANQFKSPIKTTDFTKKKIGLWTGKTVAPTVSDFMSGSQNVYVPYGYNGDVVKTGCKDLVGDLIKARGISIPNSASSGEVVDDFLTSLGYTMIKSETTSEGGVCASFKYILKYYKVNSDISDRSNLLREEPGITDRICASKVTRNDKNERIIDVDKLTIESGDRTVFHFTNSKKGSITIDCSKTATKDREGCGTHYFTPGDTEWDYFIEEIRQDLLAHRPEGVINGFQKPTIVYSLDSLENGGVVEASEESATFVDATYKMNVDAHSLTQGTNTLAEWSTNTKPVFSDKDTFTLYEAYLNKYYKADIKCEGNMTDDQISAARGDISYKKINTCSGGEIQVCYAKPTQHADEKVGGVSGGIFGSDCDFDCVADWLKDVDTDMADNVCAEEPEPPTPDPGAVMLDNSIVDCNAFPNVGAMQWLMCPVANNAQYTANTLDKITESMVEIDTSLYDNTKVEEVWGIIRDIANVLMIVLFLILVVSQLTGYGIDNYGIKKMLPKLIVVAILINLSFYICQIAIDLSNIFGVGLRNMFGGAGNEIGGEGTLSYIGTMIGGVFTGLTAMAGAGAVAVEAGLLVFSLTTSMAICGWVIVIVAVLAIIIAVTTFFIYLGIRKILVIVCIILSPLAFAARILPNTQYLFKRWWDLSKAVLVIFPICGALSGISHLLKSMSNGTGLGVAGSLVMMILPYVGFFLIPMLVKSAISALGKIGGALTALGSTVRSGAQSIARSGMKVAQSSEAYKNLQNETSRKRQEMNADRTIAKLDAIKKEKGLNDAQKLRLARAHDTKKRLRNEDVAATEALFDRDYEDKSLGGLIDEWDAALKRGTTKEREALENLIIRRHGPAGASKLAETLADPSNRFFREDGSFVNDNMEKSFNSLRANMMANAAFSNAMQNKASDAYQMITSGGFDRDNKRRNMDYHTEHNNIATQVKDWATQSTATLERAEKAGALTPDMAKRILDSTDPAIMSGINSEQDKRAILERIAGVTSNTISATPNTSGAGFVSTGHDDISMGGASGVGDQQVSVDIRQASSGGNVDSILNVDPHATSFMSSQTDNSRINGQQLLGRDIDDLRMMAQNAEIGGVGSEAYKQFVNASNEIINQNLVSNMSADKKQLISRIRKMSNPNDKYFDN